MMYGAVASNSVLIQYLAEVVVFSLKINKRIFFQMKVRGHSTEELIIENAPLISNIFEMTTRTLQERRCVSNELLSFAKYSYTVENVRPHKYIS